MRNHSSADSPRMPEVHSRYPTPPDEELIAAFKAHVRDTSRPETFPGISTAKPPAEGELRVLHHPVNLNRAQRGDTKAPCPICAREGGRWLEKGTLLWCEATSAIYCIGPDCYRSLYDDGRVDRQINALLRSQRIRANIDSLKMALGSAQWLVSWIDAARGPAQAISNRHQSFHESAPKLRGLLSRWNKGRPAAGAILGGDFLRGGWNSGRDLGEARVALRRLLEASGSDPAAWAEALAADVVEDNLARFNAARHAVDVAAERLEIARAFFSANNLGFLRELSLTPERPAPFTVTVQGGHLELVHRGEFWRTLVGVPPTPPVPTVDL